nr:OTU domain-containing protein At3g57810 [Tanacetum cinerariifolium]
MRNKESESWVWGQDHMVLLGEGFGTVLVVNELIKRRSETEWFIEGDFKAYVSHMKRSHVWDVEPELLCYHMSLSTQPGALMFGVKVQFIDTG